MFWFVNYLTFNRIYDMACMGTSFFNSSWLIHDWRTEKHIFICHPGSSQSPRVPEVGISNNHNLMFCFDLLINWLLIYVMACMGTIFFNSSLVIHDWTTQKSIFFYRPGSSQPPRATKVCIWNNQDLMFWFAN